MTIKRLTCIETPPSRLHMIHDWPKIVKDHNAMIVNCVYRILGNRHETEDVVQEVFLEAYRVSKQQSFTNLSGFLRKLAIFRAIDRLRSQRSDLFHATQSLEDTTTLKASVNNDVPSPFDNAVGNELADQLRKAIASLPPTQARVFSMRCFEDMSYGEISESLGISINAVGIALHKSRATLQSSLSKLEAGPIDE